MLNMESQFSPAAVAAAARMQFIDFALITIDKAAHHLAEEVGMSDSLQQLFIVAGFRSAGQLQDATPRNNDAEECVWPRITAALDSLGVDAGKVIGEAVKKNLGRVAQPSDRQWIEAFLRGLDGGAAELMRKAARLVPESPEAIGETLGRVCEILSPWIADARVAAFAGAVHEAVAGTGDRQFVLVAGEAVKSAATDLSDVEGFPVEAIRRAMDELVMTEPLDPQWCHLCKQLGSIMSRSAETSITRRRRAGTLSTEDLVDAFELSMSQAMYSCRMVWVMLSEMREAKATDGASKA